MIPVNRPVERIGDPQNNSPQIRQSDEVYPGFRKYFYLACIILFGTMFVVFYDVGSKLLHDRHLKRRLKPSQNNNNIQLRGDVELLIAESTQ